MLKMYQIAKMTCVVCLDDGAPFACECSAFHTRCFSDFLLRNGRKEECSTCYSRFDREMMANASSILFTRTQSTFGASHGTTLVRKLELAVALANSGGGSEAKRLLRDIIVCASPPWLSAVSKVELARALRDSGEVRAANDLLEHLVRDLARDTAAWAQHEYIEACTLLGACCVDRGRFDYAERLLYWVMKYHLHNPNCSAVKVVQCMRHISELYEARTDYTLVLETHRAIVQIIEVEEIDPARIALANLELARAEVLVGATALASARLCSAIHVLRKRKHDAHAREALPDARRRLASVIRPRRRLLNKTFPEDC